MAGSVLVIGVLCAPALLLGEGAARAIAKFWARSCLVMLRLLTGVTHRVEGGSPPTGGAILAANHQSMWETLALYAMLEKPTVILKKELQDAPLFGWWTRAAGSIAVDRDGGPKALRALRARAADAIAQGKQILIFPEGTRLAPGARAALQPGVAAVYLAAGAPVTPAGHDSGRFWRHPGPRKTPGEITLRIGAPIPPGLERRDFLRRLDAAIADARPDLALSAAPACA